MPSTHRDPHDTHFHRNVLPILTGDGLYRYILRRVHDATDAEEIAQRTAVRAWAFRRHLSLDANPKPWVYVIARHEAYRLFTERRRRRYHERLDVDVDSLERDAMSAEDTCDLLAELARLNSAIVGLSREMRETVECRYFRDMSIRETATDLGIAPGTAMSRSYRVRAQIRGKLLPSTLTA